MPFVFALLERGADHIVYWAVDHKPKRSPSLQRIRNIQTRPSVEFVVDDYDERLGATVVGALLGIGATGR